MTFKTERIEEKIFINASPHDIYEILMDSKKHSELTESKAKISRELGGRFSIYEGAIEGENLELIQDKKIVQTWKSNEENWPKDHYSTLTFDFEPSDKGTILNFKQTDIPLKCFEDIKQGWHDYYWSPLKEKYKD